MNPKQFVGSECALRMFASGLGFLRFSAPSTMLHITIITDGIVYVFYIASRLNKKVGAVRNL